MQLIIDGDACPVKESVYRLGRKYGVPVILVTSYDHASQNLPEDIHVVYVDRGQDSADFKIVSLLKAKDILITQDYGLASLVLPKQVRVLHHAGKEYTKANIDLLLEQRHFSAKMRKSGQKTKGPSKFTEEQRQIFEQTLEKILKKGEESQ